MLSSCVLGTCFGEPCRANIADLFENPRLEKTLLWNRALGTLSWEPSLYKSFEACLRNSDDAKNAIYVIWRMDAFVA